ncbi:MAG: hypothetical protein EKK41_16875 [Hyphomicrobiales bacterium]|nr:MAG: hypothetical protein EKK41_16875 [Hyphomicrobiales bacterium]
MEESTREFVDTAFEAVHRMALSVVAVPKAERAGALKLIEDKFRAALSPQSADQAAIEEWVQATMKAIRQLILEIERGGGGKGGSA